MRGNPGSHTSEQLKLEELLNPAKRRMNYVSKLRCLLVLLGKAKIWYDNNITQLEPNRNTSNTGRREEERRDETKSSRYFRQQNFKIQQYLELNMIVSTSYHPSTTPYMSDREYVHALKLLTKFHPNQIVI